MASEKQRNQKRTRKNSTKQELIDAYFKHSFCDKDGYTKDDIFTTPSVKKYGRKMLDIGYNLGYVNTLETHIKQLTNDEYVICAAIRMHDGYIIMGHRHMDCVRTARGIPRYKELDYAVHGEDQGFVTSRNRYVDRKEGLRLQLAAGIPSAAIKHGDDYRGQLYSEDLY